MDRTASSTIKGFLYQFSLSLNEILKSEEEIQIEGIIEDIDKINPDKTTGIQCKYHENVESFQWSYIHKPVLQMIKTYVEKKEEDISFVLHAYFPFEKKGEKEVPYEVIEQMINTQNVEYICNYISYIKKIEDQDIRLIIDKKRKSKDDKLKLVNYIKDNSLENNCDLQRFINDKFTFIIGLGYDELEEENKALLLNLGFSKDEIKIITYPNAIQKIATLSILSDSEKRKITKEIFLTDLKQMKNVVVSRWTKELKNYKELLDERRKQLHSNLNANYRKRCFVFDPELIDKFDDKIVSFLKNYISMYCSKVKLHTPAIFCILNYDKEKIDNLVSRLYQNDISVETGYRGQKFYSQAFIDIPEKKIRDGWIQFKLKICNEDDECINAINQCGQDDIFQVSEKLPKGLLIKDKTLEVLDVNNFEELEYLLKIRKEV